MNPTPRAADAAVSLASALREAAADLQSQSLPAGLEARVLAAVQAARSPLPALQPAADLAGANAAVPPQRRRRRTGWWAWSGAAACATVLAGSALLMLRVPPPALVDDGLRMGGFFPLVPPERWPRDAAPAWLVSTEVPGERLAALGLPYDPARAGDSVRAELLLHPSGEVLAVRVLR